MVGRVFVGDITIERRIKYTTQNIIDIVKKYVYLTLRKSV